MKFDSRIVRVAVAFVIALVLLGKGIATPFVKDAEPQSAQWIVDIVHNGRWLLPLDYYGLVDRKPPLFYWLAAGLTDVTGGRVDETRARAVSLIAGAIIAVLVLEWTAQMLGLATGWLAFLFLIGSYAFASRATTALTDMLMSLLIFVVYCLIYPALVVDTIRISRWRIWGAGLLLGLAILTKGPVVVVLLGLAIALHFLMLRGNLLTVLAQGWPWAMLTIALVIAAGWYIPAFVAGRANDLAGVFVSENFGHFMPAAMGGTGEAARPFYYIAMRLLGGALPLTLLVPAITIAFARGAFDSAARKPIAFQLAMVLAVLLFFSVASAKRDDYVLPALPPLAILFAALFTALPAGSDGRRSSAALVRDVTSVAITSLMLFGTVAVIAIARVGRSLGGLGAYLQSSDASYAAIFAQGLTHPTLPFIVFEVAIVIGAIVTLVGVWNGFAIRGGAGLAVVCVAGSVLWNGAVRPIEARSRSQVNFAAQVRSLTGSSQVYVVYFDPEFAWYYGPGAPPLPAAIAAAGASAGQKVYLVARPRELNRLAPPVRRRARMILDSKLFGGGGPPGLYEIPRGGVEEP
jgi:4-amino-4-deoxy-L-arabinose transferase-like glycosyltransferase